MTKIGGSADVQRALERAGDAALRPLQEQLAKKSEQPFVRDLRETLRAQGLEPGTVSAEKLRAVVAPQLAALEAAGAGKPTLDSIGKSLGQAAAALVAAVRAALPEGPSAVSSPELALEVAGVYKQLGDAATDPAVVSVMRQRYADFGVATLEKLFLKHKRLMPDRKKLRAAKQEERERDLASKVAGVISEMKGEKSDTKIAAAAREKGITVQAEDLPAMRGEYPRLFARVEGLAELPPPVRTDKKLALGDSLVRSVLLRALLDSSPFEPLERSVARLAGDAEMVRLTGRITLPGVKRLLALEKVDWDLLQRQKLTRVLADAVLRSPAGQALDVTLARMLDSYGNAPSRAEVEKLERAWTQAPASFPEVAGLRRNGAVDLTGRGAANGLGATVGQPKAGVRDRPFAEWLSWFYERGHSSAEVATAAKRIDPGYGAKARTYVAGKFPDLRLTERYSDEDLRAVAEFMARRLLEDPKAPYEQLLKEAAAQGLRDIPLRSIEVIKNRVPGVLPERVRRISPAEDKRITGQIAAHLGKHPNATIPEMMELFGLTWQVVAKRARKLRDAEPAMRQTRVEPEDVERVLAEVRAGGIGDSLRAVHKRLMADPQFTKRQPTLGIGTLQAIVAQSLPAGQSWYHQNTLKILRVIESVLAEKTPVTTVSDLVKRCRAKDKGFPTYITFYTATQKTLKKHAEVLPELRKYQAEDGSIQFIQTKPRADLTLELAKVFAKFMAAAGDAPNEEVFARMRADKKVAQKYPVIDESVLWGLRRKFPGVIPDRIAKARPSAQLRADAVRLAGEIEKLGIHVPLPTIAAAWRKAGRKDVDAKGQYFRSLMRKHPDVFGDSKTKRRYPLTREHSKVMGELITTMPMGTTLEGAAKRIEASGKLPPDYRFNEKTLINAMRKYPDLVPNLKEHNEALFEELLAFELSTRKAGTSLPALFGELQKSYGEVPISLRRFRDEVAPRWQKWAKTAGAPAWLRAVVRSGAVPEETLGQPAAKFPKSSAPRLALARAGAKA